ncbi:PepSY domain-containing protein [Dyella sp.]|jgi:hypothetical protein|uniref:PepSY domain-containing protein n=1 Tax=Dyella sp. TaxID=1869338 RepID=UPI002D769386|nr:PepSY domain-containing protein [Dyella sp.]HET6433182.1 PepSY domain-containing protein [Dyella sp.]
MKTIALSAALAIACGMAGPATAQSDGHGSLTEAQVRTHLQEQGYTHVDDLEFKHGMWHADARSGNGEHVDLRIDPASGKAYADERKTSRLSKDEVRASLASAGYTDVHDVEFDEGVWQAKGENSAGKDVELQIDPDTGKVVGTDD